MTERSVDVALLAFGGPGSLQQIPDFLQRMTGRPANPETLKVVEARYELIGGSSPLPDMTARQAFALEARLLEDPGLRVRVRHGFLYTEPTVAACLAELDGREVVALPLSPFSSRLTSGKYRAALDAAGGANVPLLEGWHASEGFVKAVSRRAATALDGCDVNEWVVLFTAHNVPHETIVQGDPYVEQLQETIAQLLPALVPGDWRLAFQSKGRGGGRWLEPEADDVVRTLAEEGWKKVLVVPVGFVSDNVETLYDLDILLRQQIEGLGMKYRRSAAPNDSPAFIEALADVVTGHLARRPVEHRPRHPDGPRTPG
jgi:protoporphyrin/coproporphyrin ferrochelatase